MMAGALPPVARAALPKARRRSRVCRPAVQAGPADARRFGGGRGRRARRLGEAALEYKLDGARIQVHKADDEVRVFSRNLRDVTVAVPEVVEALARVPPASRFSTAKRLRCGRDGAPHPFQITMRRFGRKLDVDAAPAGLPIAPFFFDCLYLDGDALLDEPLARRVAAARRSLPATILVPRIVTATPDDAAAFRRPRRSRAGHEGVMAKAVDGLYAAGRRGQAWLKVKQARTLDLVVLAVEWGSGRRRAR